MCQAMRIICNGTITELKKTGANCDMDCGCNPVFGPKVGPDGEYLRYHWGWYKTIW